MQSARALWRLLRASVHVLHGMLVMTRFPVLDEAGRHERIRWWSAKRFGPANAFGPHRFRHCLATTAPLALPAAPALGGSPGRVNVEPARLMQRRHPSKAAVS